MLRVDFRSLPHHWRLPANQQWAEGHGEPRAPERHDSATGTWERNHGARGATRASTPSLGRKRHGGLTPGMSEPLRPSQFEALLQRLAPDRQCAGVRYEELRRRLITIFEYRRCHHAEELADETLDRAARKLLEMGNEFVGSDPSRFVFAIAWNVARESFRRRSTVALPEEWERHLAAAETADDDEPEITCLDRCLAELASEDKNLCLDYHQGERSARIRKRSELARELGLSLNALRLKIHRITARLRECVIHCTELGGSARADAFL
jgi:DNA-directed RNA polymerase specialized sigma24 family protein